MANLIKTIVLTSLIALASCKKNGSLEDVSNSNSYDAPVITSNGKAPLNKIDPKDISAENNGYTLDMNGDGVSDYVIMRGNVVSFKKGLGNGKFGKEVTILKINEDIIAYNVYALQGQTRPSVIYYRRDGVGFFQPNMGQNQDGVPFFGDPEVEK